MQKNFISRLAFLVDMYFVRTFRSASPNTCRFKAPLILASTAFRVCSLYNNTIILRDERWILEQLRLMVAAFSVPGRIEEEFPIAKRRRRRKRLSRKKNWRISVGVCGRFSQCFFPGDLGNWRRLVSSRSISLYLFLFFFRSVGFD